MITATLSFPLILILYYIYSVVQTMFIMHQHIDAKYWHW